MKIDWERIGWREFEELCFDLIKAMGFTNVIWRQESAGQRGRDLQAEREITEPLGGKYTERWFIECKFYLKSQVPSSEIQRSFGWREFESPDYVLFIIYKKLSNEGHDLIEGINKERKKVYKIRVWEYDKLEKELERFPELVEKHVRKKEIYELLGTDFTKWKKIGNLLNQQEFLKVDEKSDSFTLDDEMLAFFLCCSIYTGVNPGKWVHKNLKNDIALKHLIKMLSSSYFRVRWRAAWALGKFDPKKVKKEVTEYVKNIQGLELENFKETYSRYKNDTVEDFLIETLEDKDNPENFKAAQALGQIKSKRAIGPLIKVLKARDPRVQQEACDALISIASTDVKEMLESALKKGLLNSYGRKILRAIQNKEKNTLEL